MICPHCRADIGKVEFKCPQCGRQRPEGEFKSAAGERTNWCARCRAIKAEKMKLKRAGIHDERK